ncbi:LIC11966 family surface protein [Neptunitalea lumnitzerae]|uniref:Uncharacterized protein n=1 Tax=Neptunitalea lumnitzerae TaxID=2965509 RepID=A0ABQ5ML70_9FLAO|nr:hypothetical protein [Neptunitalea sp. Y10]GLB50124.1 hypothetical protein Y10_24920 [Neptunitalea sp. Y10]
MKKLFYLCIITIIASTATANAQDFKTPVEYLQFITSENDKLNNQVWQYTKAVAHDKRPKKIEKTRKLLVVQIQNSREKIKKAASYNNDDTYKNQFIEFLNIYENVINNDYAKIVDMKEIAEQSYDYMEAYILMQEQVDKKLETALDSINKSQGVFAKKYDVTLLEGKETKLAKKMKISNDVFKHKNSTYLPFFKANFQESELVVSLSSNNVGEIQQKASTLLLFANEGLDTLAQIKPYQNDTSLLKATKDVLLFYKDEAEVQIPIMIDFLLLNDKIEKMGKAIENKKPKDRTKEEIEEYNNLIKDVNKQVAAYNKTNDVLNKERSRLLQQWESTSNNFLSQHIPKN